MKKGNKITKKGRPIGRTAQGEAMKKHLYKTALKIIQRYGYQSATLRTIAKNAGVSSGLFYKYFPNKSSIILQLYTDLSKQFENKVAKIEAKKWRLRTVETLELSLSVLKPHRKLLFVLIPILVGDPEKNVFSRFNRISSQRVEKGFLTAIERSIDKPKNITKELARIFYLAHLGLLLFWLLDKSPKQFITKQMIRVFSSLLVILSLSLKFSKPKKLISKIYLFTTEGLYS